jgi:3-methyladenine DNA glycosylase AlkD
MDVETVVARLQVMGSESNRAGMARFGINVDDALGISVTNLRRLAREIGRDHELALGLWETGIHEAQLLATMVDRPEDVTREQMEAWERDFDSWDLVDQCCGNLFDKTPWARAVAFEWSKREEEFVKRAAFSLMANLAVHDKSASNADFESFLVVIERDASDDRNFVKKAVNWALRQIGKRNATLRRKAIASARRIYKQDTRSARWIARDALRELEGSAGATRTRGLRV